MKRLLPIILITVMCLARFATPADSGMMPPGGLPRNISIEVEFKEIGAQTKDVKPLGTYQRRDSSKYTKQYIVVSDGLTASIRVGEDVPYIEYYETYLINNGYVETVETVFREVGTKLVVTPKIRGNYIEISLTPQISYLSGSTRDVINIQELTTTVMAANGQSINIGGLIEDSEFAGYFFKTKSASNLDITLTPRIQ